MTLPPQDQCLSTTHIKPPGSEQYETSDDAIEELVSASLLRLKFQDRNDAREELHGVRNLAREETPELVHDSLIRMEEAIEAILLASSKEGYRHAFEEARYLPDTFVNDRDFRLKFLRCELFNAARAADRMICYLDHLLHLFGKRALREPLKANFFTKEEAAALRAGSIQLLPFRDQSGRRVMIALSKSLCYSPLLRVKLLIYILHVASEDSIDSQRRGLVAIAWSGDDITKLRLPGTPGNEAVELPNGKSLVDAIPIRLVGMHFCYPNNPFFRILKAFYVIAFGERWRTRLVFHHGTKLEMQYRLMGYGIPVSHIPATDTGVVKVRNHSQWLRLRKLIENNPCAYADVCECPGLNDVLFRRAGSCLSHPGNSRFKNLLESKKEVHANSNQTEKRDIAWSIVEEIENRNGRFFAWDTKRTCWVLMRDRGEVRQKVAMSIRDFNGNQKQAKIAKRTNPAQASLKTRTGKNGNGMVWTTCSPTVAPCSKFNPLNH
eukprot:CAMPEP_0172360306 /NCGR_PEP_ID=MMETSP1060-20121228/4361_1 /TAXON_ID=37318 /ORGANISM="Pseudo-nitzschia pungens, Strain cf. cingulata" /LENGTH=492 /DNA_ID=CAMNT_0013082265 /DNA_START=259 /DNA_END=1738 /DNA_ORIENTATION=-